MERRWHRLPPTPSSDAGRGALRAVQDPWRADRRTHSESPGSAGSAVGGAGAGSVRVPIRARVGHRTTDSALCLSVRRRRSPGCNADFAPDVYQTATCANKVFFGAVANGGSTGVFTSSNLKDVDDPANATDEDVARYLEAFASTGTDADPGGIAGAGWVAAELAVQARHRGSQRRQPQPSGHHRRRSQHRLQGVAVA